MTTINDISDLIRILRDDPAWADAVRSVLLSQELLRNYLKTVEDKQTEGYASLNEALRREERRDGKAGIAGYPVGSSG